MLFAWQILTAEPSIWKSGGHRRWHTAPTGYKAPLEKPGQRISIISASFKTGQPSASGTRILSVADTVLKSTLIVRNWSSETGYSVVGKPSVGRELGLDERWVFGFDMAPLDSGK